MSERVLRCGVPSEVLEGSSELVCLFVIGLGYGGGVGVCEISGLFKA